MDGVRPRDRGTIFAIPARDAVATTVNQVRRRVDLIRNRADGPAGPADDTIAFAVSTLLPGTAPSRSNSNSP